MLTRIEEAYGSALTYSAAALNVGIGAWFGENWFLVLSSVAVVIRIGIDIPKLCAAWRKK